MRSNRVLNRIKSWAAGIKKKLYLLYRAYRHPMTPWYAKVAAAAALGYALSPIDLIPDFIPVLGYLDDIIILPLLCVAAFKLIPDSILQEVEAEAAELQEAERLKRTGSAKADSSGGVTGECGTSSQKPGSPEKFIVKRSWIVPLFIVLCWSAVIVLLLVKLIPKFF